MECSFNLRTPAGPTGAALLLQPAPALGCSSPGILLRHLPQLAALGEWLDDSGCPIAHLRRHSLSAMHCSGEGTSQPWLRWESVLSVGPPCFP